MLRARRDWYGDSCAARYDFRGDGNDDRCNGPIDSRRRHPQLRLDEADASFDNAAREGALKMVLTNGKPSRL